MTITDIIKESINPEIPIDEFALAVWTYNKALYFTHSELLAMSYARDEMYFHDGYNLLMVEYGKNK